jgi:hypothetical protein
MASHPRDRTNQSPSTAGALTWAPYPTNCQMAPAKQAHHQMLPADIRLGRKHTFLPGTMWQFISLAHHIYLYTTPAVMGGSICLDYGSRTCTVLRDMSYTGVTVTTLDSREWLSACCRDYRRCIKCFFVIVLNRKWGRCTKSRTHLSSVITLKIVNLRWKADIAKFQPMVKPNVTKRGWAC